MNKSLHTLLQTISNKTMGEQYNSLFTSFETWKGNLEKVDDVLIIGIKI